MKEEETKKKKTTTKKTTTKKSEKVVKEEKPKEEKKVTKKTTTKKTPAKKVSAKKNEATEVVKAEKVSKPRKSTKKKETVEVIPEPTKEEIVEPVLEKVEEKVEVQPKVVEEVKEEPKVEEVPAVVTSEEKIMEVEKEDLDDTIVAGPVALEDLGPSVFDGKLIQLIGWYLIGWLLTIITLGLGAPFARCFILDWRFRHTKINGKRLCFDGNGLQLWGNIIKWAFFSVITLGIFLLFLPVQWNRWVVKHTHYEGNRKPRVNYSLFDGITWEYIGISVLSGLLNLFSLGLLAPFCENLMYSWRINHTTYDTIDMEFDGKGFQLLGNYIKWIFFTIITLGIYGLWVPIKKIKWEVKHTHEKGYAKRPYRPVLGMTLPVIFAIVCLGGMIFGLTKVKKETWTDIKNDINHYVNSIIKESKKYDWPHVLVERVADVYYRIDTRDMNISWSERYERYFNPNKMDRLAENKFNEYFSGKVEMAVLDVDTVEQPVFLVKASDQYRVFWLYEKKIESHYFTVNDHHSGYFKVATDKNGSHLAYVNEENGRFSDVTLWYIDNIVDFKADSIARGYSMEEFEKNLKAKGIVLSDIDIHYTEVNMSDLGGYDNAVSYYYDHTSKDYEKRTKVWNEDEVNEELDTSTYQRAYLSYLKNNLQGKADVAVLDLPNVKDPVLVVLENDKSYVLSYGDNEVFASDSFGKATLSVIKKSTKSNEDYVLVTTDGLYRMYNFVEANVLNGEKFEGEKTLKVKKSSVSKSLKKLGYKESNKKIELISVSKDDYQTLSDKLEKNTNEEEVEGEDYDPLTQFKVGKHVLSYGDYTNGLKDEEGGTYSIFSNGSYTFVNQYTSKKGKIVTIRETGTYLVKNDEICMEAKKGDTSNSTGCFFVDMDNVFTGKNKVVTWTYTKAKAQLLN